MRIGWDGLDASTLRALDAHEFEGLVRDLVDRETRDRWSSPCPIEGPSEPYVQDGARDLILRSRSSPHCTRESSKTRRSRDGATGRRCAR
jgi:hypothetical protein